ncbi:MAG: beta-propeller domain-containing protein, partial [Candidatus Zixiibacteriota bacterium]
MLIHTIYIRLAAAALAVFLSSGLSLADTATPENPSPWVYWINADSADISFSQMTARLKTLDVSDPEQILSFSGTTLWTGTIDIKVVDTIMFALNVNGLQILDISNITSPVLIRQVHLGLGGYYNFMFVDGSELYVGRNDRVLILDISNPVDPQELSVIHLQGMVHEMLVQDNRAYFGIARYSNETNTDSPALYICDVTDPTTPSIVGKYESPLPHKDARRFVVVGDYIYSINHFDRFLDVISIVDETNPIRVNTLSLSYLYDIACYQGYLYVYSGTEIKVYDITSPELPVLQSTYNAEGSGIYLEIHNDKLYAMKYYDPVFTVFDLSTPTELDSIGYHVARGRWYSATLHGDHLYIPEGSWGLTIADISNPYDIERIGEFSNDCSTLMGIDAKGDYAYLTNYMSYFSGDSSQRRNGIYVIDATDKQNPEFVKWVSIAGNTSDAFIHDSLLIISQCPRTHIFSLADPLNPVYIQRYPVQDYIYSHSTTARGTVMYICGSGYGFELASIADPSNPYPLANVKAPSVDSRATITALLRGNRAYV